MLDNLTSPNYTYSMTNNHLLKFRVWDTEENKFCDLKDLSNGRIYGKNGEHLLSLDQDGVLCHNHNHTFVFQQFTGLLDKNGKEIFEGDIVKYHYCYHLIVEGNSVGEVKFENGRVTPILSHVEDEDDFYSYIVSEIEVIGNICQNLNLLEK